MMMHGPSPILFLISAILALVALLAARGVKMPGNSAHAVYVALVAWLLLAFGVYF